MHKRFFAYLSLCFIAYSVFSYMNVRPLYFILLFLILLPVVSFLMLLLARHYVRWAIRTEHDENYRLEEGRAVLSLLNLSFFFFPHITVYIDSPDESKGFIINGYASEEIKDKNEWQEDKGFINFPNFPEDIASSQLLTLSDSEYVRTLEDKWLRALSIPFKKFFIFPRFVKMRRSRQHVVYLAAYARYDWHFRYTPTHVGQYDINASKLYARDYFGFFSLPLRQNKNSRAVSSSFLKVMPNSRYYRARFIHNLPEPQPSDFARANNRISNEINALANIRAWRPGDRMKDIHFNVSSKHQSFFVKEYEDPRRGGILFLVDPYLPQNNINPADYMDELCETSSSIIEEMNKGDGPLVLRFADQVCEGASGEKNLKKFLLFLSRQKIYGAELRRLADKQASLSRSSSSLEEKYISNRRNHLKKGRLAFLYRVIKSAEAYFSKIRTSIFKNSSSSNRINSEDKVKDKSRVLPSLNRMLRQEFKSEKYRGIIVISPSFTPLLAETLISAAKQKSTRIVFVHLEEGEDTKLNLKNAQKSKITSETTSYDNNDESTHDMKLETMSQEQRELLFRRLEAMKVIIFHVSLDSLSSDKKNASHLKVVSRTELRKHLKRNRGKHYIPHSVKNQNKKKRLRITNKNRRTK